MIEHHIIQPIVIKRVAIAIVILTLFTGCSGTMQKLGIDKGKLTQCPDTPNCVNSQSEDEKHFIQPLHFTGTQQQARSALKRVLTAYKRTKIIVDQEEYIRAEFVSRVFRFVDDVEFYLTSDNSEETVIDVRSASRVGYSDFGVNRKRIEHIRSKLNSSADEP
ncbi:MAG: DUF1499 domain-containing protein [Candidatus Thiodiazotropha sp.]